MATRDPQASSLMRPAMPSKDPIFLPHQRFKTPAKIYLRVGGPSSRDWISMFLPHYPLAENQTVLIWVARRRRKRETKVGQKTGGKKRSGTEQWQRKARNQKKTESVIIIKLGGKKKISLQTATSLVGHELS